MRHPILHLMCLVTCALIFMSAAYRAAKPLGHGRRQDREVHDRHGAQVGRRRLHE